MAGPNMKRNQELAGKSVKQGNYTITYNENGYAQKAIRDNGASATHTVQTTHANDSAAHQEAYQAAQRGDWDAVGVAINKVGMQTPDNYGGYDMSAANKYMQELQDQFKYNANDYYQGKYDSVYGEGAWDGGTGTGQPVYNEFSQALVNKYNASPKTGVAGQGVQTSFNGQGMQAGFNGQSVRPGTQSGYTSFNDFLSGMGYDDYTEQTKRYIQAAVQNAVQGFENQIDTVNKNTEEMARQAYIANMLGQKNMDQKLAAEGMAGGMADSQKIALQANYENNLNRLEMERQATVRELQTAIENAKLTGDMQAAQELSNYLMQVQGQWANYMQNQQQIENQNYWKNMERETEGRNTARNWALTLIQSGTMPDETTLTAAGMTTAEAQSLLNYARQQNAPKATPTPKYTAAQAETALMAIMGGSNDAAARAIVEGYYGMPAETVMQAYGETTGADANALKGIEQSVGMNRTATGQAAAIRRYLEEGQITEEQAGAMLLKFGLLG